MNHSMDYELGEFERMNAQNSALFPAYLSVEIEGEAIHLHAPSEVCIEHGQGLLEAARM